MKAAKASSLKSKGPSAFFICTSLYYSHSKKSHDCCHNSPSSVQCTPPQSPRHSNQMNVGVDNHADNLSQQQVLWVEWHAPEGTGKECNSRQRWECHQPFKGFLSTCSVQWLVGDKTPSDPQWQWWEIFSLHDIQSTLAHRTFNSRCRTGMFSGYKGHFIWCKGNQYMNQVIHVTASYLSTGRTPTFQELIFFRHYVISHILIMAK